jgi:hypothetical protein
MNKGLKNFSDLARVVRTPKSDEKCFDGVWTYMKKGFILGKVHLESRFADGFKWTDGYGKYEVLIKFTDVISNMILVEKQAADYLKSLKFDFKNIDKTAPVVLFIPCPFILVFPHKSDGASFLKNLRKSLNLYKSQSHTEEACVEQTKTLFGAIFDISEKTDSAEGMKDFEVTFINDNNSHLECFSFDKTQKNMYTTANNLMDSLKPVLNPINLSILQNFLHDIIRLENLERVSSLEIIQSVHLKVPSKLDISRKENSLLRNTYLTINPRKIEKQGLDLLEKSSRFIKSDPLGKALAGLHLQKLQISLDLCQVANAHGRRRNSFDSIKDLKVSRNNDSPLKDRKISKSPIGRPRRKEMNKNNGQKKSFFRNACDCIVF